MASHSSSRQIPFGAAKLCHDIATLLNNRQGSDIQFKVGGGNSTQENGETVYDESTTVTLYAHSLILRCRSPYLAVMLDENEDLKERSNCVIYKPNISASTFENVLRYIYTGDVRVRNSDNIFELITVASEMGLEELATECQFEFIRMVKCIFSNENDVSTKRGIPIDIVIRTHIIPALNLASDHPLSHLSQEVLPIIIPHISVIIKSPDAYTTFINGISSESLIKIIASDDLAIAERSVWDLALIWACHQTKLSKTAIEARLNSVDGDENHGEESLDGVVINDTQLKQLKEILTPLLPSIRFSLFDPDDYKYIVNILIYMLPRRRLLEINQFFMNPDSTGLLDAPRKRFVKQKMHSKIVAEPKIVIESRIVANPTTWEILRRNIFETGGIVGCHSLNDLKFGLLFRASEHGFLASTFHQRCNGKGPTLVIVKSSNGYIFGGVNFNHWKSDKFQAYSSSISNFLFALPDGLRRKDPMIFRIKETHAQYSSYNNTLYGPAFGGGISACDLVISDSANTNQKSFSNLPNCYNGSGASNTVLAGSRNFTVSDYEVFVIFK